MHKLPDPRNAQSRPVEGGGLGEFDRSGKTIGTAEYNDPTRELQALRIAPCHLLAFPTGGRAA